MSGRWTRRAQGGEGVFFSRPGSEIEDRRGDAYINMRDEMPSDAWVTYGIVYWPQPVKIIVYFIGLIWSFLAVGIIADVFMAAIEVITSAEKTIKAANGEEVSAASAPLLRLESLCGALRTGLTEAIKLKTESDKGAAAFLTLQSSAMGLLELKEVRVPCAPQHAHHALARGRSR